MAKFTIARGILVLQSILLICAVRAQNGNWGGESNGDCRTPNNLAGVCTLIKQCQSMLNLLTTRPLTPQVRQFLRQSQCGVATSSNDIRVCCPMNSPPGPRDDTNDERGSNNNNNNNNADDANNNQGLIASIRNNPYLPTECGKDLSSRIVGGERTELGEYPWMALLEYTKPNGKTTACGGVLVSNRYVLTAAHCVNGKNLPKSWRLSAVRLGEYDTSTDRDCVQDGRDTQICSDDPLTVSIEEKIVHESYRPHSVDQKNDLALMRLSQSVRFTNYIKPICLPTSGDLAQTLWVAGWGKTENRSESNIKLKLGIPPVNPAECSQKYKNAGIDLGRSQLCAGGKKGKDSCRGDSGGPLMAEVTDPDGKNTWAVVGVVSFGPNPCGMQDWPGVYTKIVDYVPWILSKLRA